MDTPEANRSDNVRPPPVDPLPGHAWALWVLSSFTGLGLGLTMICGGVSVAERPMQAVMTAALISGASMVAGGFLGFLFGIPRTTQSADTPGNGVVARAPYLPNTNLEQISDWLTKILVGVGLTQIASLPARLDGLAAYTAGCFGGSKAMSLAVLVYFSLAGFLIGFLWTRLYLPRALRDADVIEKLEATQKLVGDLQRDKEVEREILTVVERQLSADAPPVSFDALAAAITKASHATRTQIFYRAAALRTTTWRDELSKPLMERTIPIFRALIQADPTYYRTHGQLGFALKDSRRPDWQEALNELTTAIELRDRAEQVSAVDEEWADRAAPWYEYVRAQCRINLDANYAAGEPSDEAARQIILADIRAALALGTVVVQDDDILGWSRINKIDLSTLVHQ
jgi:hypothetical protein